MEVRVCEISKKVKEWQWIPKRKNGEDKSAEILQEIIQEMSLELKNKSFHIEKSMKGTE